MSGITRAKRRAKIYFATNRRIHGLWQTTIPSRFVDELPEAHVEVVEAPGASSYGGYAQSRFDRHGHVRLDLRDARLAARAAAQGRSGAPTRAAAGASGAAAGGRDRGPLQIEGELVAQVQRAVRPSRRARACSTRNSAPATVAAVDGNKLTVDFDKAGRKMVLDSFVTAV